MMERRWAIHFGKGIFVLVWALPIALASYAVWKHYVPVPFYDEWNTPGAELASWYRGTLNFAELCSQHNESRLLFPRLIYLPLCLPAGWDARQEMALLLGVVCFLWAALYRLVRATIRSTTRAHIAFSVMNLLLFSPRQYESFLCGNQWLTFFPALALICATLVNLSGRSLRWKTICNGVFALVSTYTFVNGMALWVLAFPIDTAAANASGSPRPSKFYWRIAYVVAAGVSIGCYFFSYQRPPTVPPLASFSPRLFQFFLIWLGSLFTVPNPSVVGAVVLLLFLVLAAIAVWLAVRNRDWRPHYPWLLLGTYALASDAATAIGRVGFGLEMAGDFRYAVFSVMLYIAIVGLAWTVYQQLNGRPSLKSAGRILGAICAAVVLTLWASTYKAERRVLKNFTEYRSHVLLLVRWADAIPQNPELAWISPFPETPGVIHTLAKHDALRPRFVGKELARAVAEIPKTESAAAGVLEEAAPDGMGRLVIKGWARLPDKERPADCIVLGLLKDERWQLRWVLGTGDKRSDVAQRFGTAALERAGFSRPLFAPNLPTNAASVRAWAIDLQNERAFPLVGEINIGPAP